MSRPRLCGVCHCDASWALQEMRPYVSIARDGTVKKRTQYPVNFYYCDDHIGEC